MKRLLLTLAAAGLLAPPARADVGPFIPGAAFAEATVSRIEIAEDLPEHVGVWYTSFGPPRFAEGAEYVHLSRGSVLEFTGRYRDWAELILVRRSAASGYQNAAELAKAARDGRVEAVSRRFHARETVPAWAPQTVTLSYRVRTAGEGPEIVRTSWDPLWQWYVVALLAGVSVLLGGLRLVRRGYRRRAAAPAG